MFFLLAACTDPTKPDDTGIDLDDTGPHADRPPGEIRVVDPEGALVPVEGVAWFDPSVVPVPVRDVLVPLRCADGEPPCAVWVLDGELPARVQLVTERFGEPTGTDESGATCFEWDAPWTVMHVPADGTPQVIHLVLHPEQRWCDDGVSAYPVPGLAPPSVHPDDDRVTLDPIVPALTLRGVDPAGEPLPLAIANWYYPPESPEYDGEHPLLCADELCATWVLPVDEYPTSTELYVNGTWMGPLHPFVDPTWTDYQGSPTEPEATVTLQFDTTVALVE